MKIVDKVLHHQQPQGFRHRLSRFFGWDHHDEPKPLPRAPKGRGPVEHGPTKAPFSRNARRLRNRAAHRSMMRNQRS